MGGSLHMAKTILDKEYVSIQHQSGILLLKEHHFGKKPSCVANSWIW